MLFRSGKPPPYSPARGCGTWRKRPGAPKGSVPAQVPASLPGLARPKATQAGAPADRRPWWGRKARQPHSPPGARPSLALSIKGEHWGPLWALRRSPSRGIRVPGQRCPQGSRGGRRGEAWLEATHGRNLILPSGAEHSASAARGSGDPPRSREIGRASCRERV